MSTLMLPTLGALLTNTWELMIVPYILLIDYARWNVWLAETVGQVRVITCHVSRVGRWTITCHVSREGRCAITF